MALFSSGASGASLPIGGLPRVNLLPRSVSEGRERSLLLKRWGWGLLGALLVVVLTAGASFAYLTFTAAQLGLANARTTTLLGELAALAPVRAQLNLVDDLTAFRTEAMTTDVAWSQVSTLVAGALPEGVVVTETTLSVGAAPQGEDRAVEVGVSGTLTLESAGPVDIVSVVRSLRGTAGVYSVDGQELEPGAAGYTYLLSIAIDQSVYTGAYAEEASE